MIGTPINDPKWWHFATTDGHKITVRKDHDSVYVVIIDGDLWADMSWTTVEDAKDAAMSEVKDRTIGWAGSKEPGIESDKPTDRM